MALINFRNALMTGKRGPTAKDYVQTGLVAMWDGIENAGWGVHDASATTWKDLVGNRDWTLGPSTSYEWTANSFDAKDQFAATQDFIDGSLVSTVEFCARIKTTPLAGSGNFAYIIIGRAHTPGAPYYGLLVRGDTAALMACHNYWIGAATAYKDSATSMSFPDYLNLNALAYFNGVGVSTSMANTLNYNATTRGTVARIGGTLGQSMSIEVFNMRLYSTVLTAAEIARNYAIDKARFNLP